MPGASVEQASAAFFVWHAEALAAHPPAEEAGVITRANGTLGLFLRSIAELCNGSTYDSDSYCLGSNPSSAATPIPENFSVFGDFSIFTQKKTKHWTQIGHSNWASCADMNS